MSGDTPKREARKPWTALRILKYAAVCTFGVGVLYVVLAPPSSGRTAARLLEAQNSVKNQALAATNYFTLHDFLPPYGHEPEGGATVSWMTAMLPQMDQRRLHDKIDFTEPFDAPANAAAFGTRVRSYLSPWAADDTRADGLAPAHWAGNRAVFQKPRSLDEFPDGVTHTLLIGEVNAGAGRPAAWGDPANLRTAAVPLHTPVSFGGNGPGGIVVIALADGRATYISETIDPAVFAALGTPDGGEPIPHIDR